MPFTGKNRYEVVSRLLPETERHQIYSGKIKIRRRSKFRAVSVSDRDI